jgi:hypothetical protein
LTVTKVQILTPEELRRGRRRRRRGKRRRRRRTHQTARAKIWRDWRR